MRRTSIMTLGFVLIFIGIQLNLVETYVLTPRFSSLLSEHTSPNMQPGYVDGMGAPNMGMANPGVAQNSPFYQASYLGGQPVSPMVNQPMMSRPSAPKIVTPPSWICWPVLFLGTVVFLHGFSVRRD